MLIASLQKPLAPSTRTVTAKLPAAAHVGRRRLAGGHAGVARALDGPHQRHALRGEGVLGAVGTTHSATGVLGRDVA